MAYLHHYVALSPATLAALHTYAIRIETPIEERYGVSAKTPGRKRLRKNPRHHLVAAKGRDPRTTKAHGILAPRISTSNLELVVMQPELAHSHPAICYAELPFPPVGSGTFGSLFALDQQPPIQGLFCCARLASLQPSQR